MTASMKDGGLLLPVTARRARFPLLSACIGNYVIGVFPATSMSREGTAQRFGFFGSKLRGAFHRPSIPDGVRGSKG